MANDENPGDGELGGQRHRAWFRAPEVISRRFGNRASVETTTGLAQPVSGCATVTAWSYRHDTAPYVKLRPRWCSARQWIARRSTDLAVVIMLML